MGQRILIVGGGCPKIITKAHELGLQTVLVDDHRAEEDVVAGCAFEVADLSSGSELVRLALKHRVNGICATPGPGWIAAAHARAVLGLPGLSPDAAERMTNECAAQDALMRAGIPCSPFATVSSLEEAESMAREIGLPLVVRTADGHAGCGAQRVDHIEDLSLAYAQAKKRNPSGEVTLEPIVQGDGYRVDTLTVEGLLRHASIVGRAPGSPQFGYDAGIFAPAPLDEASREEILNTALDVLRAMGVYDGAVHVEITLTEFGARVAGVAPWTPGARIPTDLTPLVSGVDFLADVLRIMAGMPAVETPRFMRGAALYWIPSNSGVVTAIGGLDAARSVPGVREAEVFVRPGDTLGHTVDCASRDRIGYVLTTGKTVQEAVAAAKRALARCRVVTSPTRGA